MFRQAPSKARRRKPKKGGSAISFRRKKKLSSHRRTISESDLIKLIAKEDQVVSAVHSWAGSKWPSSEKLVQPKLEPVAEEVDWNAVEASFPSEVRNIKFFQTSSEMAEDAHLENLKMLDSIALAVPFGSK